MMRYDNRARSLNVGDTERSWEAFGPDGVRYPVSHSDGHILITHALKPPVPDNSCWKSGCA